MLAPLYTYESAFFKACDVCVFGGVLRQHQGVALHACCRGLVAIFQASLNTRNAALILVCHQHKTFVLQLIVGTDIQRFMDSQARPP